MGEDRDDDDYGRAISALLHHQPQAGSSHDLVGESVRTGRAVRRRRRLAAGSAALAAAAVLVSATLITTTQHSVQPATPTIAAPTPAQKASPVPSTTASQPPTVMVDAALSRLPVGSAAGLQWLQDGRWHQRNGLTVPVGLPQDADQGVQAFSSGDQLLVTGTRPAGNRTTRIVDGDGTSTPLGTAGRAFARGPAGSIIWLEGKAGNATLVRLNPDQTLHRYAVAVPHLDQASLTATRRTVLISSAGRVTQLTISGPGLTDPHVVDGAEEVAAADPSGDDVVLTDSDRCTFVVSDAASTPTPADRQCRYRVSALSAGARYRYGYDLESENGAVIDSSGHTLAVLRNISSLQATFDANDQLQLIGSGPGPDDDTTEVAVVSCRLPLKCRRVSDPTLVAVNSGRLPIVLIN